MLTFIIIIIAGILLDQLTKIVAINSLSGITTYPIIPNVLHFTYVENTGAAFNIFTDMRLFLIIVTLIFIAILGYLFYILPKTRQFFLANLGLSLMLSGALGNLLDRIRLAYVVDFIEFRFINFAVFNIADSLVVIGAGILLYAYLKNQLILPGTEKPVNRKPPTVTPEYKEKEPIRKDVLKDLVYTTSSSPNNIDPVVETEIIRLRSNTTFVPIVTEDKGVKVYTSDDLESDTGNDSVIVVNENRYTQYSDHYLESIEKQRKNTERINKLNSYNETIDRFESQVQSQRENRNRRKTEVWEPEISESRNHVKTYQTDWNPQLSENTGDKSRSRYYDQISQYEKSVQEQKERKQKQEQDFNWKDFKEIEDTEPVAEQPNRYYESADHYMKSIEKIKNKNYIDNE